MRSYFRRTVDCCGDNCGIQKAQASLGEPQKCGRGLFKANVGRSFWFRRRRDDRAVARTARNAAEALKRDQRTTEKEARRAQ